MYSTKRNRVRQIDIAEKLNCSVTTVSKALRNSMDISPQTAKHIQVTAERMGYIPNTLARNLSTRKTNMIGMIVPQITDSFIGELVESMYDMAYESDYTIVLMVSKGNPVKEKRQLEIMMALQVSGIVISIAPETSDYRIFEKVKSRKIPVIFINTIPAMKEIRTIHTGDYEAAFKDTEQAINSGYNYIAYIGINSDSVSNKKKTDLEIFMDRNKIKLDIKLPFLISKTIRILSGHT